MFFGLRGVRQAERRESTAVGWSVGESLDVWRSLAPTVVGFVEKAELLEKGGTGDSPEMSIEALYNCHFLG